MGHRGGFVAFPFHRADAIADQHAIAHMTRRRLLPEDQPSYVASWIYVFGMGAVASLAYIIVSGMVLALMVSQKDSSIASEIGLDPTRMRGASSRGPRAGGAKSGCDVHGCSYSRRPRRIPSATAAARSETPSFS